MNRRTCLKALAGLYAGLVLPFGYLLHREHPRIEVLRNQVLSLPVDENYRGALLRAIVIYHQQIIDRHDYAHGEGWEDLNALHEVTQSDMLEQHLASAATMSR
jgi:hypothetical protein